MKNFTLSLKGRWQKITTTTVMALVVIFVFIVVTPVFAAQLETGLEYGTFTGLGTQDIRVSIMRIVQIALGFIGVIAIAIIVYAGFVWMTSAGNPERIDFAKRTLRNAVIGLVIILLAFSIVSFIINQLQGVFGPGGPGGPPNPCDGCGHLGTGIIESVYPAPYATDVSRNTNIIVTFKVQMDPGSIISGVATNAACDATPSNPCRGTILDGSVQLEYQDTAGQYVQIPADQITAASADGRTYVFDPTIILGDGVNNVWHQVTLTNDIRKDNGDVAFSGQFGGSFAWSFQIGTFLDLDPPKEQSVFPRPDDTADNYSQQVGTQATGGFTVTAVPQVAQSASVTAVKNTPTGGELVVNGNYNGTYNGALTLTFSSPTAITAAWNPARGGAPSSYTLTNGTVTIGDGIILSFSNVVAGEQWTVTFVSLKSADTLRVANRTYTFVSGTPAVNEIQVDSNLATIAQRIEGKVADDTQSPDVSDADAADGDADVDLIASKVGEEGNNITFNASSGFINPQSGSLNGGTNSQLVAQVRDVADEYRNAILRFDFNEPVNPALINNQSLRVQYDSDPNPLATNWVDVAGQYLVSNQYKTVEFLSNSICGVCSNSGDPCTDSTQCGGGSCDFVQNSCGDALYCLPVLADGDNTTTAYDATQYRVTAKAALLKDCSPTATCNEQNYGTCVETPGGDSSFVCANQTPYDAPGNFFYPEAQLVVGGFADLANNSFNGNKNTYSLNGQTLGNAEGPEEQSNQPPYSLNTPSASDQGDDLLWSFFINKQIKLTPPQITQVGPDVEAFAVSLTLPFQTDFDGLMFGSTLKPGSGYRDGLCGCDPTLNNPTDGSNPQCATGETCDGDIAAIAGAYGKCKNPNLSEQQFCAQDSDCDPDGPQLCVNRKYLSLIDRTTAPAGFWVTQQSIDVLPQDGYADYNTGQIQHTKLQPVTDYAGEAGSGLKDVYQNCYLPSQGPAGVSSVTPGTCMLSGTTCDDDTDCTQPGDRCNAVCNPVTGVGCCGVLPGLPYCCNGVAMTQADWEADPSCFTGY